MLSILRNKIECSRWEHAQDMNKLSVDDLLTMAEINQRFNMKKKLFMMW